MQTFSVCQLKLCLFQRQESIYLLESILFGGSIDSFTFPYSVNVNQSKFVDMIFQ